MSATPQPTSPGHVAFAAFCSPGQGVQHSGWPDSCVSTVHLVPLPPSGGRARANLRCHVHPFPFAQPRGWVTHLSCNQLVCRRVMLEGFSVVPISPWLGSAARSAQTPVWGVRPELGGPWRPGTATTWPRVLVMIPNVCECFQCHSLCITSVGPPITIGGTGTLIPCDREANRLEK